MGRTTWSSAMTTTSTTTCNRALSRRTREGCLHIRDRPRHRNQRGGGVRKPAVRWRANLRLVANAHGRDSVDRIVERCPYRALIGFGVRWDGGRVTERLV